MNEKVEILKGKLIVSCQALPHEPLHSSFIMGRMALAAKEGGHPMTVIAPSLMLRFLSGMIRSSSNSIL